ncbi:pre-rRNA processing protein ftsj3 [Cichlidogyrus casuarinus]|uniref:Pre-rRNA processing protein ftsj3 n=1 Tax=Cichlidogyrus casuarinus TaxID=1844966 RepID=A0ABD2Q6C6_9PLAT
MFEKNCTHTKQCCCFSLQELMSSKRKGDSDEDSSEELFQDFISDEEELPDKVSRPPETKKLRKEEVPQKKSVQFDPSLTDPDSIEAKIDKATSSMKKMKRPLTAQERALAVKLIQSAKSRRDLLDSNYHRFRFFEDEAQLPDWFVDDEKRHMRKPVPVVVEKAEQDQKQIQGRTIKKVEEAKMRKKKKMAKKLKKVRQKVDELGDDLPEREKWAKIKTMYQKAGLLKQKRRPIHYVVNKKGGNNEKPAPKGAKIRLLDRRMKTDMRGQKKAEKNKKRGRKTRK